MRPERREHTVTETLLAAHQTGERHDPHVCRYPYPGIPLHKSRERGCMQTKIVRVKTRGVNNSQLVFHQYWGRRQLLIFDFFKYKLSITEKTRKRTGTHPPNHPSNWNIYQTLRAYHTRHESNNNDRLGTSRSSVPRSTPRSLSRHLVHTTGARCVHRSWIGSPDSLPHG